MNKNKKIHFEISERKVLLRVFDVLVVLLSLYVVGKGFRFDYFDLSRTSYLSTAILGIYLLIFGSVFEMYILQVASDQYRIIKSIILTTSTTVLVYLLTPIYTPFIPSHRIQIVAFYLVILISLFLWRVFYVNFLASNRFIKKVVIICDKNQLNELVGGLENVDPHYRIVGVVNSNNDVLYYDSNKYKIIEVDQLVDFVNKNSIAEIVVASQDTESITVDLYNQLIRLLENGNIIREYTQVYEFITKRIPVQYVSRDFYRYFPFSRNNQNRLYIITIRIFDVILSLMGLVVTLILIPIVLIINLFGNKGKLFYYQERVGLNGKVFQIVKFRTMVKNAEQNGAVFSTVNDSRVTPFGKFLRRTRIDEFPQFINVLKGEMALIGPRPERPVFVNEIAEKMPFYKTRHVIKPGLTGWAQVNYSYGESIDDSLIKLQYDLYYIKHRSVFIDINIILRTFSTILFYRGQ